jgi:hypothetical protein
MLLMTETVILPPEGRRTSGGRFIPPLLIIPFLLYHLPALTMFGGKPDGWTTKLVTIPMVSGGSWSLTWSDLFLLVGLVCLFFEVLKSTNTGRNSVIEHMASTALFVVFLVEFLLFAPAASSTFFLLMAMALVDVVAGFTISITGAGRDVTMAN